MHYQLLPQARRTGPVEGASFRTLRLQDWTLAVRVAELVGGEVDLEVQIRPSDSGGDWVATMPTPPAALLNLDKDGVSGINFKLDALNLDLRVVVSDTTTATEYVIEVTGTAAWIRPDDTSADEYLLLHPHVRSTTDGTVIVEQAEDAILDELRSRLQIGGRLDRLRSDYVGVTDVVRRAIAEQAHYIWRRRALQGSTKAEYVKELRRMRRISPAALDLLRPVTVRARSIIQHW